MHFPDLEVCCDWYTFFSNEPLKTSAWEAIRTDDGPNLASKEMENNLEEMGVVHHHTTPHLCDPGPMAKLSVKISHS